MTALAIYRYDHETGELLSTGEARVVPGRSALPDYDPTKWLIPADATTVEPPTPSEGHVAIFDSGSGEWDEIEDHRGDTVYVKATGAAVIVDYLGELSDLVTTEEPPEGYVWGEGGWEAPPAVPATVISRRQLLLGLLVTERITEAEAIAAAQHGSVPTAVMTVFNALEPAEKAQAIITWASMTVAERDHPLVAALAVANGMSEEDVDAFFELCAAL